MNKRKQRKSKSLQKGKKDETVTKGWGAQRNETLWHKTNEDTDYLTHEGEGNRWKGKWPETRGELDIQNKTGNSRDKKPKQGKTSPLCDTGHPWKNCITSHFSIGIHTSYRAVYCHPVVIASIPEDTPGPSAAGADQAVVVEDESQPFWPCSTGIWSGLGKGKNRRSKMVN